MLQRLIAHRNFTPSVLSLLVILLAAVTFFHPILGGKELQSSDVILVQGMQKNVQDYRAAHDGEDPYWSMSMFSGMPANTIHIDYKGNWVRSIFAVINSVLPLPISYYAVGMMFAFWLFRLARAEVPLALAGALAFGFFSYHIIITEAGHGAKLAALLFAPGVLASIYMAFNGRMILGSALLVFTLGLELYTSHVQITYYLVMIVICYGLAELIKKIQEKKITEYFTAVALMSVAAGIAFGLNATSLLPLREYNEYSIRGKSELKVEPEARNNPKAEGLTGKKSSGVDREYAFNWSNGRDEVLTLLIPNFKGGASGGKLSENSEMAKAYGNEVVQQGLPLYWGTQPFTSGPTYAGAVICFLSVLGMFLIKSPIRFALLYATLLFVFMSMGKNSISVPAFALIMALPAVYIFTHKLIKGLPKEAYALLLTGAGVMIMLVMGGDETLDIAKNYKITDLLFDSLPLYNKFRAPASILGMVGITMCWLAVLGAQAVFDPHSSDAAGKKRAIIYAAGVTAGLALFFAVMGSSFYTFKGISDEQIPAEARPLLQKDRAGLLTKDAFRSVVFIIFAAGLLMSYVMGRAKNKMVIGLGIAVLCLFDLFSVGARYLWKEEYVDKSDYENNFLPREADQFLLTQFPKDKLYYRIFPMNRNPFNDGSTPYHLNTIGGYNAAKVKRYQQLIEAQISKMNMNVINMLNTEFLITDRQAGGMPIFQSKNQKEFVYKNPENYGPAWIVKEAKTVAAPDEALYGLDSLNTFDIALVEKSEGKLPSGFATDSVDREKENVVIKKWENKTMTYEYNSPKSRFVVFSEVYYPKGWTATIDGKEAPIFQTNFVLRGMVIPSGKHTIEFKYSPNIISQSSNISLICSVLMVLALGGAVFYELRKKPAKEHNDKRSPSGKQL